MKKTFSQRYVDKLAALGKQPDAPTRSTPEGVCIIALTRGYYAIVDPEDFEFVASIKWRAKIDGASGRVYATAHKPGSGKHGKSIQMHRLILGVNDPGVIVDHRDGDGLNNRRQNLRRCTIAQNVRNQATHRDKRLGRLKGVYRLPNGMFRAQIMADNKKFNLGAYPNEEIAARVYDAKAVELHGEFARLNFASRPEVCA